MTDSVFTTWRKRALSHVPHYVLSQRGWVVGVNEHQYWRENSWLLWLGPYCTKSLTQFHLRNTIRMLGLCELLRGPLCILHNNTVYVYFNIEGNLQAKFTRKFCNSNAISEVVYGSTPIIGVYCIDISMITVALWFSGLAIGFQQGIYNEHWLSGG